MNLKKVGHLAPAELKVCKALRKGPANSVQVTLRVFGECDSRQINRNTALELLKRLERRGVVGRIKNGKKGPHTWHLKSPRAVLELIGKEAVSLFEMLFGGKVAGDLRTRLRKIELENGRNSKAKRKLIY